LALSAGAGDGRVAAAELPADEEAAVLETDSIVPDLDLRDTGGVFGVMQQSGSVLVDRHGVVRHAHGATIPTASYDKRGIARARRALGNAPEPAR
jgi:hypothetical protein